MINNTYNYDELKNQVKNELKQAITEGGQEALTEGLAEIMSKKLSSKKIKFNTKELTEYIQEQITTAINNVDLNKTVKKTRGINIIELMGLSDRDLKDKIKELENIVDETAKKIDAKKLLGALYVAKDRGIDYSDIFGETDLKSFIKEYKIDAEYIKQITEEISSIKPQKSKFFEVFVDSLKELDKVKDKTKDFRDLYKDLLTFIESAPSGTRGNAFWDNIINNYDKLDNKTKALIKTLGTLKSINDGANNQGGLVGDDKTILTKKITDKTTPESIKSLKNALDEAFKSGVQCSRILDIINDKQSDLFLEIQETAKGTPISSIGGAIDDYNPEVFKATDEQITKLISDLKKLYDIGLEADVENLSNVFYDINKGFTLIDLDLRKEGDKFGFSSFEEMFSAFVQSLRYSAEDINDIMGSQLDSTLMDKFADRVEKIGESLANATKQGYAEGQKSNSPSKDFEKLENDAVAGIKKGAERSKDILNNIGSGMADDVKKGFESRIKDFKIDLSSLYYEEENTAPNIDGSRIIGNRKRIGRYVSGLNNSFNKSVEDILDEQDALDENLQKQRKTVESKKEELQVQKEINNELNKNTVDVTSAILSALNKAIEESKEFDENIENIEKTEEKITPIKVTDENTEQKLDNIKKLYEEFEEIAYGGDSVYPADKVEYFERLRAALLSLTEEDLDNLDLGKKFSIDKFGAKLENTIDDMKSLSEEVYNLGDNDDWSDEYTVLEGIDEEYKSIYKDIKYVCDILDVAKVKNNETFDVSKESSIIEKKQQEITETQNSVNVKEAEKAAIKEIVKAQEEEKISVEKVHDSIKESSTEQISDYEKIKQKIKETQEEIDRLNNQDASRLKMPKYIDDVYNAKSNKYGQMSNDEFNNKIIEKSQESISTATHDFRVQLTSILAMIDEAKKRGQSLKFEDLISGSPEELKIAKDFFEKIVSYIRTLNDETFVDDIPQKLAAATQKLRDLKNELKDVAENSNDVNFFDYKLNGLIEELKGKRRGINSEDADSLLKLLDAISSVSGKDTFIENYTDNEKIIAGVNKRIIQLKDLEEQAAQHAREAALAEKQQAEANERTSDAIKEQTMALVQNTEAQEINNSSKNADNISLPNSIKTGFKDEGGVVSGVVSSEVVSLDELKNKIFEVRDAIENKTLAFNEELSTVERVVADERNSLNLLRDKLAEIKGYVEELYSQIGNIGKIDFSSKIKVDGLSSLLSSLKDDKLNTKLTAIYTYLDDFAKAVNKINFKNNLTDQLNGILSKGEELKNLANILKKVNKASIKEVKDNVDSKNIEELKKYNSAYQELINTEEKFIKLNSKQQSSLLSEKEATELSIITSRRDEAWKIIRATTDEIRSQSDAESQYTAKVRETVNAYKAGAEARAKLETANNRNSLEKQLTKEIEVIEKMTGMSHKYTDDFIENLKNEIKDATEAFNGTDEEIQEMITHLKQVREAVPTDALESTYLTLDKYQLRIQNFMAKNTAMSKEFKEELQEIYNTIQKYKDVGGVIDTKEILSDIVKIETSVARAGQTGKSTADKLKRQLASIWRQDFARYFGLYDIIRYIRQISTEVIKVDTALTELRKVSDASNERLQQSLQKSTETAKDLGSTIDDVIKVTSDWARLGYNVDDAEELARVTTLFKNVGDNMSAEDASSFMISTLKGFEMEADQAIDIADKFNEVANNFAIDTMGIGDALQRSAASFNAANTDLNESIALITATNAVVQNPESVGK